MRGIQDKFAPANLQPAPRKRILFSRLYPTLRETAVLGKFRRKCATADAWPGMEFPILEPPLKDMAGMRGGIGEEFASVNHHPVPRRRIFFSMLYPLSKTAIFGKFHRKCAIHGPWEIRRKGGVVILGNPYPPGLRAAQFLRRP